MFKTIKVKDGVIILPEGYMNMFTDMESLKSFITGRLAHEAERLIRSQVYSQMKDMDFYENKGI